MSSHFESFDYLGASVSIVIGFMDWLRCTEHKKYTEPMKNFLLNFMVTSAPRDISRFVEFQIQADSYRVAFRAVEFGLLHFSDHSLSIGGSVTRLLNFMENTGPQVISCCNDQLVVLGVNPETASPREDSDDVKINEENGEDDTELTVEDNDIHPLLSQVRNAAVQPTDDTEEGENDDNAKQFVDAMMEIKTPEESKYGQIFLFDAHSRESFKEQGGSFDYSSNVFRFDNKVAECQCLESVSKPKHDPESSLP